jgi:hypothetical protein
MRLGADVVYPDPRGFELVAHGTLNNARVRLAAERDDVIAVPDRIGNRGRKDGSRHRTNSTAQGFSHTHDEFLSNTDRVTISAR